MAAVIIDVSVADQIPPGLVRAHIAGAVPGGHPAGLSLAARPLRSPCSDVPNPAARTAPLAAVRHECRATSWFDEDPCSARRVRDTASRRQPLPACRPGRARQGCAPPSHRGARISAPPAGITERVGSPYRTRIAGITLRRPRRLYLCRRCPRPLPAAPQPSSARWSRPVRIDVCSMFARMPRYAPAASGIRSALRIPGDSTKWQLPARTSML
jgi:hypothetical protein